MMKYDIFSVMESIRRYISNEEFDYQTLLHGLGQYSRPRDKISELLRKGVIVRVKKGIYIFGEDYRRRPFSREILANLIYGPSYISLEYALHYFGLIPERVEAVTSVTTGRSRRYATPVGLFRYRMIPLAAFRIGMDRVELDDGRSFLIATPEKALADKIRDDRGAGLQTQRQLMDYLENNLRVDSTALANLNSEHLGAIARRYGSRKLQLLSNLLQRLKRSSREVGHA
jgi:predicted transcriptional regulator of viral defense system